MEMGFDMGGFDAGPDISPDFGFEADLDMSPDFSQDWDLSDTDVDIWEPDISMDVWEPDTAPEIYEPPPTEAWQESPDWAELPEPSEFELGPELEPAPELTFEPEPFEPNLEFVPETDSLNGEPEFPFEVEPSEQLQTKPVDISPQIEDTQADISEQDQTLDVKQQPVSPEELQAFEPVEEQPSESSQPQVETETLEQDQSTEQDLDNQQQLSPSEDQQTTEPSKAEVEPEAEDQQEGQPAEEQQEPQQEDQQTEQSEYEDPRHQKGAELEEAYAGIIQEDENSVLVPMHDSVTTPGFDAVYYDRENGTLVVTEEKNWGSEDKPAYVSDISAWNDDRWDTNVNNLIDRIDQSELDPEVKDEMIQAIIEDRVDTELVIGPYSKVSDETLEKYGVDRMIQVDPSDRSILSH